MQLNPARGRKLEGPARAVPLGSVVYAAQPREGTETLPGYRPIQHDLPGFMQLNPARGRKLEGLHEEQHGPARFMQLNPARGRKLKHIVIDSPWADVVYAAQPREGTETRHLLHK